MNQNSDITCPISGEIMTDPVVAEDGYSYQREFIEEWLSTHNTSPMTRNVISETIVTNNTMRSIISSRGFPLKKLATAQDAEGIKIVLVLDVSGSMDQPAKAGTHYEPTFSKLDLIKHSVTVIGGMLSKNDKLCTVVFSDSSRIVMPWTVMDSKGKEKNQEIAGRLCTEGSTNIVAGLEKGINENGDHVILLTDGENSGPVNMIKLDGLLRRYTGKIHTVGLGMSSDLDTVLLRKISSEKGGFYCYCPDQSMVGSVFIHLIANICVNEQGEKFDEYDEFMKALLYVYKNREIPAVKFRNAVLNEEFTSKDSKKGQIGLSLRNWDSWGKHYLPAFIDGHINMMTTNFMDESMQGYKTPNTDRFIKRGELIFSNIDPPVPSCNNTRGVTYTRSQFVQASLNRSGECFGPDTKIRVPDTRNSGTKICDLKKGDTVITTDGLTSVECVIVCSYSEMVRINDFWITKTHPIFIGDNWVHPGSLSSETSVKKAYNLVLENRGSILIGNIPAVTMGHGLRGGIVEHDYFGTERVISDLMKLPGWEDGKVQVNRVLRNNEGHVYSTV